MALSTHVPGRDMCERALSVATQLPRGEGGGVVLQESAEKPFVGLARERGVLLEVAAETRCPMAWVECARLYVDAVGWLSVMCLNLQGVESAHARELLRKAVFFGNADAITLLGSILREWEPAPSLH